MKTQLLLFVWGMVPLFAAGACGDERGSEARNDGGAGKATGGSVLAGHGGGLAGEGGQAEGGSTRGGTGSGRGGTSGQGNAGTSGAPGSGGDRGEAGTGGDAQGGAGDGGAGGTTCESVLVPLRSPGFDDDAAAWIPHDDEAGPSRPVIVSAASAGIAAETPPNVALLGGVNDAHAGMLQSIALPGGATSLTLTGYRRITTEELGPVALDGMSIDLWNDAKSAGGFVGRFVSFGNDDATGDWVSFSASVDVSGSAGRSVELDLWAETDSSLITEFFVDSLSLSALVCP